MKNDWFLIDIGFGIDKTNAGVADFAFASLRISMQHFEIVSEFIVHNSTYCYDDEYCRHRCLSVTINDAYSNINIYYSTFAYCFIFGCHAHTIVYMFVVLNNRNKPNVVMMN